MSAWTDAALVTDADLTAQESRMPAQAQKIVAETGASAYDGKRALAKRDISSWLQRRKIQTSGIVDPSQFNRAATFLELSYIYRDLAQRNDTVAAQKAEFYYTQFSEEIEGLQFDYQEPETSPTAQSRPLPTVWRS